MPEVFQQHAFEIQMGLSAIAALFGLYLALMFLQGVIQTSYEIIWEILLPVRLPLIWLALICKRLVKKKPHLPQKNAVPRVPTHVDEPYHKRERGVRVTTAENINEHYQSAEEYIWLLNVKWPFEVLVGRVFHMFGLSRTGKSVVTILLLMEFARLFFERTDQTFKDKTGQEKEKQLRIVVPDPDGSYFNTCIGYMPDDVEVFRYSPDDAEGIAWDIAKDIDSEEMAKLFVGTLFPKAMLDKANDKFWLGNAKRVPMNIWRVFDFLGSDWRFEDMIIPLAFPSLLVPLLLLCPTTRHMAEVELKGRVGKDIHLTVLSVMDDLTTVAGYWQKAKIRKSFRTDFLQSPKAVFHIACTAASKDTMGLILHTVMSVLVNLTLRLKSDGPNDATSFLIDEMADLADLGGTDLIARQGAKSGLGCFSAALSKEALVTNWGADRTNEFLSLTTAKFVLNSSLETAKWFSENVGTFEGWQESRNSSTSSGTNSSRAWGGGPGGGTWQSTVGDNFGRTFGNNQEMKQRLAVLVSEITGLPIPDILRGFDEITGFGFSGTTGLYKFIVEGGVEAIIQANNGQYHVMPKRPKEDARLLPWTEDNLKRLKIPRTSEMMAALNSIK